MAGKSIEMCPHDRPMAGVEAKSRGFYRSVMKKNTKAKLLLFYTSPGRFKLCGYIIASLPLLSLYHCFCSFYTYRDMVLTGEVSYTTGAELLVLSKKSLYVKKPD
jgi:hypothetical protein